MNTIPYPFQGPRELNGLRLCFMLRYLCINCAWSLDRENTPHLSTKYSPSKREANEDYRFCKEIYLGFGASLAKQLHRAYQKREKQLLDSKHRWRLTSCFHDRCSEVFQACGLTTYYTLLGKIPCCLCHLNFSSRRVEWCNIAQSVNGPQRRVFNRWNAVIAAVEFTS